MGLELHYFPTSHWSRIIALVLAEKGLDPQRRVVDIRKNATFEPEYMRLNPRGVVPTLVIDGEVICDSMRIAKRLDAAAPPELYPDEPVVTAWADRLEAFPAMLLSYSVWVLGKRGEKSADILDDKVKRAARYAAAHPELRALYERKQRFFAEFRDQVYDPAALAAGEAGAQDDLDALGDRVAEHTWIAGDRYTFPDAIATSILYRLIDLGKLDAWSRDPNHPLTAYYARLRARPSFDRVF